MVDNFSKEAPHMRADPEPDGAMALAAYSILITIGAAILLVGWLCLG